MAEPTYIFGMRVRNIDRNLLTPLQRDHLIQKAGLPKRYAYGYSDKEIVRMSASVFREQVKGKVEQVLSRLEGSTCEATIDDGQKITVQFTDRGLHELRGKLLSAFSFMPFSLTELENLGSIISKAEYLGDAPNVKVNENGKRTGNKLKRHTARYEYFKTKNADGYDVYIDIAVTDKGEHIVYSITNSMPTELQKREI